MPPRTQFNDIDDKTVSTVHKLLIVFQQVYSKNNITTQHTQSSSNLYSFHRIIAKYDIIDYLDRCFTLYVLQLPLNK